MALSLIPLNPDLYPPGAFQIPGEAITFRVGRVGGNDLQVNHSSVSAEHARLETRDGDLVDVVDCGSTNGTFVNGIRVDRKQLMPGDLLRFATAEFRVTAGLCVTSERDFHVNGSGELSGNTQTIKLSQLGAQPPKKSPIEQERDQLLLEVERLATEVSDLNFEQLRLQSSLASREEEISRFSERLAAREVASEKEKIDHQAMISGLNRTIQEQEQVHQSVLAGHAAERDSLFSKLGELEKALAALSEESAEEIKRLTRSLAERDAAFQELKASSGDEIRMLNDRLREGEERYGKLSKESEERIKDIKLTLEERSEALREITTKRESEVASLSEKLAVEQELSRKLRRDLEDYAQREQRNLAQITETRKELMDRESRIAALHYEVSARDGNILLLGNQRQQLQQEKDLLLVQVAGLQESLDGERLNLAAAREACQLAETNSAEILRRLGDLGERLSTDWSSWFREIALESGTNDAAAIFSWLDLLASRVRRELDLIEPVWQQFGDHVQEELAARCGALREEESELTREILERQSVLASLKADLEQFRDLIDIEVRRAQGLSRRGTEIEIPERFEAMVIAKDREQEIYRALVDRIEVVDRILEKYRGTRKLRELVAELTDLRGKLADILVSGGVEPFQVEPGTFLSLRHRKEVKILSRKGWGTSQYSEHPYQPGEVFKVVRPGYRTGSGDQSIIIRKVEVLIRGTEG